MISVYTDRRRYKVPFYLLKGQQGVSRQLLLTQYSSVSYISLKICNTITYPCLRRISFYDIFSFSLFEMIHIPQFLLQGLRHYQSTNKFLSIRIYQFSSLLVTSFFLVILVYLRVLKVHKLYTVRDNIREVDRIKNVIREISSMLILDVKYSFFTVVSI